MISSEYAYFSKRWRKRQRALTLVEVVVGLMLLSTLLVVTMLAFSLHAKQIKAAERKAEALRAIDSLIANFYRYEDGVPIAGSGELGSSDQLAWRSHLLIRPELESLNIGVVRVEAWDGGLVEPHSKQSSGKLIAAVELLIPLKRQNVEQP